MSMGIRSPSAAHQPQAVRCASSNNWNTAVAGICSAIRARHARHATATSGGRRQARQRVGHAAGREGLRVHVRPHTQAGQTVPVVRLVVAHGHHQLRDARGQPLGYRADAAVMDQRLAARQDLAEWHVRDMSDLWWERGRKLFRIAGHEQGPEAEPAAGFESHVKEPARLQVRRPGREQHRCVSGIQERREVLGHGNSIAVVVEREPRDHRLRRPVRLLWAVPFWKQRQHLEGRHPVIAHDVPHRMAETEFGPVRIDSPRQESVRPKIPDPVEQPSQPARRLSEPFHPCLRHRGIFRAQEDGRLKLNRHQRHLERLRRNARPERDPRPHQQRSAWCEFRVHSGDDLRVQAGRQKSDQFKTPPRVPEIGVPHDLLEILVHPVAERPEAGGLHRPVERPVHDNHDLVAQRGQPLPQPDERVDVARASGRNQDELPLSVHKAGSLPPGTLAVDHLAAKKPPCSLRTGGLMFTFARANLLGVRHRYITNPNIRGSHMVSGGQ